MEAKLFANLAFRVEVEEVAHPDGRVVVFQIPARPAGTAYAYKGAYFMRVGEELQPMSEDQLRAIFVEKKPSWLESFALENCSAQEVVALIDTQSFFDLLKQPYPSTQQGVLEKLVAEKLVSESPSGFAVSNLAAILLAKVTSTA